MRTTVLSTSHGVKAYSAVVMVCLLAAVHRGFQ